MAPSAVFTDPDHAESTLRNYCDGVLYKDLFALAGIRQNEKFMHLVKLLAYNVGSEVNYDNLARDTGLSRTTVADYLQLGTILHNQNLSLLFPKSKQRTQEGQKILLLRQWRQERDHR